MSDKIFVDTNILVYSRDLSAGEKHVKALEAITSLWKSRQGVLSVQVLNEYFVTVTQKLKPGMSAKKAWEDITALSAWGPVQLDWKLLKKARALHSKHSLSWWDSLIIAAAQISGCSILYSEDLTHDTHYDSVKVINPFF